jgi:hypothetical protein
MGGKIRRTMVQSQTVQIVHDTLSQKNSSHKMAPGVTQDAVLKRKNKDQKI